MSVTDSDQTEPDIETQAATTTISDTPSRQERRRMQRMEDILSTTEAVLQDKGYAGVVLDEIAEKLNLSKASLYYYFKSKDELIFRCLQGTVQRAQPALDAAANVDGDARTRLLSLLKAQARFLIKHTQLSRFFIDPDQLPPEMRGQMHDWRVHNDARLREIVAEGMADGTLSCLDLDVASRCVHGAMNNAALWIQSIDDESERERLADTTALTVFTLFG